MSNLLNRIALTLVPNIGPKQARTLLQHVAPDDLFKAKTSTLEKIEGLGFVRIKSLKAFTDFARAEAELQFIEKYNIQPIFIGDPLYPKRLLHCCDAPTLLYFKGNADLNAGKIIAIVGTRAHTDYGKAITEQLVAGLEAAGVTIISGLAHGIDTIAHRAAIKHRLPTIGVLAHGLDTIYPHSNTHTSRQMLQEGGGLLTEFMTGTMPDRYNFPSRNRIVAGMSDATIVVETDMKGGSMITAELAAGYDRDVFAVPGRTTDKKSSGCNRLILDNKAILFHNAKEVLNTLGWHTNPQPTIQKNRSLFIELSPDEQKILHILNEKKQAAIDEINILSGLSASTVAAAILNLELQQVIRSLPGKIYTVL